MIEVKGRVVMYLYLSFLLQHCKLLNANGYSSCI